MIYVGLIFVQYRAYTVSQKGHETYNNNSVKS